MRPHMLIVVAVLFLPACSSESMTDLETTTDTIAETSADKPAAALAEKKAKLTDEELKAQAEAKRLLAEAKAKADAEAAAKAEAARIVKLSNERLGTLQSELQTSTKAWTVAMRSARTRAAYDKAIALNPATDFATAMVELAEEFPDTEAAEKAWKLAVTKGAGAAKNKACSKLLEVAEAAVEGNPDCTESFATFAMLMRSGTGEAKTTAMTHVLSKAEQDPESDDSFALLRDLVLIRGKMEPKQKAISVLQELAAADVASEKSGDCLAVLTKVDDKDAQSAAVEQLIEHHVNHSEMIGVLDRLGSERTISPALETNLKTVCENANGHIKGKALVTLVEYIAKRDRSRKSPADPEELPRLESMLEEFVNGHEPVIASAKKQLFVLQHLSIGKQAPDIVGVDLAGVEFKLSEYRGKIVFLDFWGDW